MRENLPVCSNCEKGRLHKAIGDVKITRQKLSATVKKVSGRFCDACDEIEFDETTDSADRYAAAGDKLVLKNREIAAAVLKLQRKRLNLTQSQASRITGGGQNAFSRYGTGAAQPIPAVINLFKLLDKHPEVLKELDIAGCCRLGTP